MKEARKFAKGWPGRAVLAALMVLALLQSGCAGGGSRYFGGGKGFGSYQRGAPLWTIDNPEVARFREYYLNTRTVEEALQNSRPYLRQIEPEFRRRGLPMELAYLPMLESRFEKRADSGHAKGLWQFVPSTASSMGLKVSKHRDDRLDTRKSTQAAAAYLNQLGERFDGDWTLALAAYNGGPGYMEEAMDQQNTRNFWRLRLRQETAEYVPRFIAMLQVARQKYPHLMVVALNGGRHAGGSPQRAGGALAAQDDDETLTREDGYEQVADPPRRGRYLRR